MRGGGGNGGGLIVRANGADGRENDEEEERECLKGVVHIPVRCVHNCCVDLGLTKVM